MRLSQVGMSRKYRVRHNFLFLYNHLIKFLVRSNINLWYIKPFWVHAFWEEMNIAKTQNYTWRHNKVVDLLNTHVKIDKLILWSIIILVIKSRAIFKYIFTIIRFFQKNPFYFANIYHYFIPCSCYFSNNMSCKKHYHGFIEWSHLNFLRLYRFFRPYDLKIHQY